MSDVDADVVTLAGTVIARSRAVRADAERACAIAAATHRRTHGLTLWSGLILTRHRRPFAGGAGSPRPEDEIRGRLLQLIDSGRLPARPPRGLWAGRSPGGLTCAACDTALIAGETEYEPTPSDGHGRGDMVFHLRCIELWALEAERRAD